MDIRIANIIIWDNKAFVPSNARYCNGPFISIKPVFILNPTLTELVPVLQSVLSKEPLLLPNPTREDLKAQQELLPKITGARSWKKLGQNGIAYVIELTEKGFLLEMSRLDKKGRWEFDPNKRKTFAPGTDLSIIIQALLEDLETRKK